MLFGGSSPVASGCRVTLRTLWGDFRVLHLRSGREIEAMRRAGLVVWRAHQAAAELIRPGVTTAQVDAAVAEVFRQADATPLFLGYPGPTPFPAVTCISVNEEIVHGIPGDRVLAEGDIVCLDTGCRLGGWCGDAAYTYPIGPISTEKERLIDVTRGVLDLAIRLLSEKTRWSQVAREMQAFVEDSGFSVVKDFVGHGIGRAMHEPPQVPNYYDERWARNSDFDLRPGIVLAIEPMVTIGTAKLRTLDDGWTQVTADGKAAAHFEHTVAITQEGVRILTCAPQDGETFLT